MTQLTIAVPKGYLFEPSVKLFSDAGICVGDTSKLARKLTFFDEKGLYRFIILRPADVPVYVEHGAADIGISGRDVLDESHENVARLKKLEFGYCRLVVAALKEKNYSMDCLPYRPIVATKFVHSAQAYFERHGIHVDLIKLYGSIELAPLVGLSDLIVDLVATGQTLKEHGLIELDTIFESTAILVANKVSLQQNYSLISSIIQNM